MVIDGDVMEHFQRQIVDAYPAVSNQLMERRESWKVDMLRALTSYSCESLSSPG